MKYYYLEPYGDGISHISDRDVKRMPCSHYKEDMLQEIVSPYEIDTEESDLRNCLQFTSYHPYIPVKKPLLTLLEPFLNEVPGIQTGVIKDPHTGKIVKDWALLFIPLHTHYHLDLRGRKHALYWRCKSCHQKLYRTLPIDDLYVTEKEVQGKSVFFVNQHIAISQDIYDILRSSSDWNTIKKKIRFCPLRVLKDPLDGYPHILTDYEPKEMTQKEYEKIYTKWIYGEDDLDNNDSEKVNIDSEYTSKNIGVVKKFDKTPETLLTQEDLKELFKKYHLQKRWFAFNKFLRSGISVDIQSEEKRFPAGRSRIGGLPDLPSDVEWPCGTDGSLAFLGQFNMNEIKPFDLEHQLPSRGMLYFFYHAEQDVWGISIQDFGNWSVLYSKTTRGLKRAMLPKDLNTRDHQFPACDMSLGTVWQIPSPDSPFLKNFFEKEEESETYRELYEEYKNLLPSSSYLLGYPVPIQNDMEESCESIYCDHLAAGFDRTDQKTINTLKNAVLWRNLLQLSSEGEANMNWGDCGQLNFMIREDELKEKQFENVWMELQCY